MMNKKRWLAAVLSVVMVLAYMPSMAFAKDDPPEVPNTKIENGILTWGDAIAGSDGVGAEKYELQLLRRDVGGSPNYVEDNTVTHGEFNAGKAVVDASKEKKLNLKSFLDAANAAAGEWSVRVTGMKADGVTPMSAATTASGFVLKGPDAGAIKEIKIGGGGSTFDNDGKVKIVLEAVGIDPTNYEVKLYRNTVELGAGANQVPASATLIKDFDSTKTEVDVSDYVKYVKPTGADPKNYFFVTIKAKRPGLADSKMVLVKRTDALEPPTIDAPVVNYVGNGDASVTNKDYDKVTFQLYKRIGSGAPTKAGAAVVKTDYKKNDVVSFASQMTDFGAFYYVGVIAESKVGAVSKEVYSSAIQLKNKTVAPTSVVWEKSGDDTTGKAIVAPGKAEGKFVAAADFKVTLFKKGVKLAEVEQAANAFPASTTVDLSAKITALPGGDVKDLKDYTLQVVGTNPAALDSDVTELGESITAPATAYWNLNVKTDAIATWTAVAGVEKYEVTLHDIVAGKDVETVTVPGNATEVSLSEYMELATNYKFRVVAVKGKSKSAATESIEPHMQINGRLEAPESPVWDKDMATWKAVSGAIKYKVQLYRNGTVYGDAVEVAELKADLSKAMDKAGDYTFKVKAISGTEGTVNSKDSVASPINAKEGGPLKKVGKVKGLKGKAGKTKVTLSWKKAKNANKYKVFMKKGGSFKVVKTVSGTKCTVRNLKKGKTYYFKVRAYFVENDATIKGAVSAVKKIKTKK